MTRPVYIGIDLGGTNVRSGAFTSEGGLLTLRSTPIEAHQGPQAGVERIIRLVEETISSCGPVELLGIGMGCTGPLDTTRGSIHNPYTLPTWEDVPIIPPLQDYFGVPGVLENDADVAALGEYWHGAGQGVKRLYMVTVGTGIGAALVVDGEIYHGMGGVHPEGGHTPVDPRGPLCYCGFHGCWESLAAGPAIGKRMRQRLQEQPDPELLAQVDGDLERVDARLAAEAARRGHPLAQQLMGEVIDDFCLGLASVGMLVAPELILLGGGVMRSVDLYMPAIQRTMQTLQLMMPGPLIRVAPAALGEHAGLYGAAFAAIQNVKKHHNRYNN